MLIEVQIQAYVLAVLALAGGDADKAIGLMGRLAGYEADTPMLSHTMRDVARLARGHVERERTALGAGAVLE